MENDENSIVHADDDGMEIEEEEEELFVGEGKNIECAELINRLLPKCPL